MELLGFSRWTQINEQEGSSESYLLKFPNPGEDQEDRKELFLKVINEELPKLYPNYQVEIEEAPSSQAKITFTYQDDEFSLFGDTGSTKPVTIFIEHTGFSVFTAIKQWSVGRLRTYAHLFETPGLGDTFLLTQKRDPIDLALRKTAYELAIRAASPQSIQSFDEPTPPSEEQLDKIAFGETTNTETFTKKLLIYLHYKSFYAYLKSVMIGQYTKTAEEYSTEIETKVTQALQMDFNGVDMDAIEKLMPVLQDLYFHSNERRAESKIATPLLVKLLISIKEKSGNLNEFLKEVNRVGAKSRKGANQFM